MKKYLVGRLDPDGKPVVGTVLDYPDEYTHEVTEEQYQNMHRLQIIDGDPVLHAEMHVDGPETIAAGVDFDLIVSLPEGASDTEITLTISAAGESGEPETLQTVNGLAFIPLRFDTAGTYQALITSRFNGVKNIELVVTGDAGQ